MFTKQEASALKQQFWTSFGQYLAPIPSATGNKVNWINYKTGVRHIQFKMDATTEEAYIGIEVSHPDPATRQLFFGHFRSMRTFIEEDRGKEWIWEEDAETNGKNVSRIYQVLNEINIYRQTDWPNIISFLKTRILSLDKFWAEYREVFEMLQ